ncbi:platelet endothelial aggregation receptor 1-like isoform X2 [Biomphalaria pfeifferi]|uniref:Platelet endothelial aggregation receptor 1-like isoform X2 n=1 Tax=Biomphalaria pfeifferi TaxID=112525 RepID=A0AAD8C375_BIOPF|nr:platelet endothelial aggregation receptor 1-like isoform X2 [Biomphalaria pfeifferi]
MFGNTLLSFTKSTSWILILLHITSDACDKGWFGERCQYKCHCQSDCDKEGQCVGNDTRCDSSWFGTKCQHYDLSTTRGATITASPKQTTQWLTDRDSKTCNNDPKLQSLTIVWDKDYIFTWMRMVYRIVLSKSVEILFNQLNSIKVLNCSTVILQDKEPTLGIHCNLNFLVRQITIRSLLVDLCDVYISGGVNFALKQRVMQSSNYSDLYYADKAVDGDLTTFSHTKHEERPFWSMTLSTPRLVHRIVLQNRMMDIHGVSVGERLQNFELLALDENRYIRFYHKDNSTLPMSNYTVVMAMTSILEIKVYATFKYAYGDYPMVPVLTLSEVEVYGECCPGSLEFYCNLVHKVETNQLDCSTHTDLLR